MGSAVSVKAQPVKTNWHELLQASKKFAADKSSFWLGVEATRGVHDFGNNSQSLLHVAGCCKGFKSDQDAFVVVPKMTVPGAGGTELNFLCAAVFDGHGSQGAQIAKEAARLLPGMIQQCYTMLAAPKDTEGVGEGMVENTAAATQRVPTDSSATMLTAINQGFEAFQAVRQHLFHEQVELPMKDLIDQLVAAGMGAASVPMKSLGGTTATLLFLELDSGEAKRGEMGSSPSLPGVVSWVGDSRAVLAASGSAPEAQCVRLIRDHSTSNPAELRRLDTVPEVKLAENYLGVNGASEMLQVTRSLGDCASHRHMAVLCQPEHNTFDVFSSDSPRRPSHESVTLTQPENSTNPRVDWTGAVSSVATKLQSSASTSRTESTDAAAASKAAPSTVQPKAAEDARQTANTSGPRCPAFVLLASDGVWHVFGDEDATTFVSDKLEAAGYRAALKREMQASNTGTTETTKNEGGGVPTESAAQILQQAVAALVDEAHARATKAQNEDSGTEVPIDDVTAVVLTFKEHFVSNQDEQQ